MRLDTTLIGRNPLQMLRFLSNGLRNGLTFEENFKCSIKDVLNSGAANADIVVAHNLGKVPDYYIWNIDRAGIVYDQNKAGWTTTSMTLRCSVANAVLKLVVF